jgi:hypothetical protein
MDWFAAPLALLVGAADTAGLGPDLSAAASPALQRVMATSGHHSGSRARAAAPAADDKEVGPANPGGVHDRLSHAGTRGGRRTGKRVARERARLKSLPRPCLDGRLSVGRGVALLRPGPRLTAPHGGHTGTPSRRRPLAPPPTSSLSSSSSLALLRLSTPSPRPRRRLAAVEPLHSPRPDSLASPTAWSPADAGTGPAEAPHDMPSPLLAPAPTEAKVSATASHPLGMRMGPPHTCIRMCVCLGGGRGGGGLR